ncbi:MAG TPA: sensor domain-containing diguanylate cyclase, partial [Pseudolysinimonas sp.]|nr:sensor domain-containing diguanylate cyclase [Pseudolysinimonas sp.]
DLAAAMPGFAGLLVRSIGGDGDFIAWFRGEMTRTMTWLGDMSPANRRTPLSPRNSFSAWSEEVRGTSAPWDESINEARELGRDLESTMLHRVESRLAELALHDALTGLPNRRLLMERLEQSLARPHRQGRLAVLFVDLDDFKSFNDSFGHAAGDAVLVEVGRSLRSAARSDDTVARLGGDEFVVLCDDIAGTDAEHLAQRLLEAVRRGKPASLPRAVSASIGVAVAPSGADASQVLSAADTAMYRAKLAGRDRVAV